MSLQFGREQRLFFRDELRSARAAALLDAEGYEPIITAFERLGSALVASGHGLGDYRDALLNIARKSNHAYFYECSPGAVPRLDALFTIVSKGRNEAVHQGAFARHFVRHCTELALALEEGLMVDSRCISDFMVSAPACAQLWQPVAFARQQMLLNSYSYLPILKDEVWHLLSDLSIARYLSGSDKHRKDALRVTIEQAVGTCSLSLTPVLCYLPSTTIYDVLKQGADGAVLIVSDNGSLLGIATPFDLL